MHWLWKSTLVSDSTIVCVPTKPLEIHGFLGLLRCFSQWSLRHERSELYDLLHWNWAWIPSQLRCICMFSGWFFHVDSTPSISHMKIRRQQFHTNNRIVLFFFDEDIVGHTETTRHHRRKLGIGWSPMACMIHCRQGLMVLCWARSIFMSEAQKSHRRFFCFKRTRPLVTALHPLISWYRGLPERVLSNAKSDTYCCALSMICKKHQKSLVLKVFRKKHQNITYVNTYVYYIGAILLKHSDFRFCNQKNSKRVWFM